MHLHHGIATPTIGSGDARYVEGMPVSLTVV
jgi:hypothetical protein